MLSASQQRRGTARRAVSSAVQKTHLRKLALGDDCTRPVATLDTYLDSTARVVVKHLRLRLSLLHSNSVSSSLVDLRQMSDAKSFLVFLLIFVRLPQSVYGYICRPDFWPANLSLCVFTISDRDCTALTVHQ